VRPVVYSGEMGRSGRPAARATLVLIAAAMGCGSPARPTVTGGDDGREQTRESTPPWTVTVEDDPGTAADPLFMGSHEGRLGPIVFSSDGSKAVTCRWSGGDTDTADVEIWDAGTGALLHTLRDEEATAAPGGCQLALDSSGTRLATEGPAGIGLWDVASGRRTAFVAMDGDVAGLVWSPTGEEIVASARTGGARYFDVEVRWINIDSERVHRTIPLGHTTADYPLVWGELGPILLVRAFDERRADQNDLRVINAFTGRARRIPDALGAIEIAILAPDGQALFWLDPSVAPSDGEVFAADLSRATVRWHAEIPRPMAPARLGSGTIALSRDSSLVAVSPGAGHTLSIWNAATGAAVSRAVIPREAAWEGATIHLTFSPDAGSIVAAVSGYLGRVDNQPRWESVILSYDVRTGRTR